VVGRWEKYGYKDPMNNIERIRGDNFMPMLTWEYYEQVCDADRSVLCVGRELYVGDS
jgi:hypothetical protein